jgi:hypothetical protein
VNNSNTSFQKYRGCVIRLTPTEKHPDMVTVIKTVKSKKGMLNKKYVNLKKCILQIDEYERSDVFERVLGKSKGTKLSSRFS